MTRFTQCLKWIIKWEGTVYTNDPDDAGGPTRYGVIQVRYDQYRRDNKLPLQSVRNIAWNEVEAIYRRYYWDVIKGDALPAPLDLAVFNVAVNSGTGRAIPWLNALPAAVRTDPLKASRAICDRYEGFYNAIVANRPSQRKFLRGWLNRLNDCRQEIEETSPAPAGEPEPAAWSLLLNDKPLGPAWANGEDAGRPYFPVRRYLMHLFPEAEVNKRLTVSKQNGVRQVVWDGRVAPVTEVFRPTGRNGEEEAWGRVRDMAVWQGLEITVVGDTRTLTLSRASGAAKAEGDDES
jgi:hypothetical protein